MSFRFEGWILRLQVKRGDTCILLDPVDRAVLDLWNPGPIYACEHGNCISFFNIADQEQDG
jgi:hypothetical protein